MLNDDSYGPSLQQSLIPQQQTPRSMQSDLLSQQMAQTAGWLWNGLNSLSMD